MKSSANLSCVTSLAEWLAVVTICMDSVLAAGDFKECYLLGTQ